MRGPRRRFSVGKGFVKVDTEGRMRRLWGGARLEVVNNLNEQMLYDNNGIWFNLFGWQNEP